MDAELSFIIIIFLICMAFGLSFSIGANDETPSPLAAAGTIKFKLVLIVGGTGLAIGMIFLSEAVASLVGQKILGPGIKYTIFMLLAVLLSSIIWLIIGSFAGIPLSSTHSLIGSIFGVVIVYAMFSGGVDIHNAFNWEKLTNVVISWIISPLAGLLITFILYRLMANIFLKKRKGLNQIEDTENKFAWALVFAVFGACIWTGANSAEALGILYALYSNGSLNLHQYYFFVVICAIFAFIGMYVAGRYVIKTLASQMTDARPSDGFIIQVSAAIILAIATLFGVPISHSHVMVFCFIGLNMAQKKEVDYKGLGRMSIYWVLTFPIAAIMAGIIYFIFISNGLV